MDVEPGTGDVDSPAAGVGADAARSRIPVGFAVVRGRSMLPTLADGDRLLVRYLSQRRGRRVRPGRLVVISPPDRPVAVKRLRHRRDGDRWVESDNTAEGTDSRTFGPLPARSLIAVVVCRVWPRPSWLRSPSSGSTT